MREYAGFSSELKFVVSEDVAAAAREWSRRELDADPHGGDAMGDAYRTASLYFDTDAFDLYNRRGSTARAKFRVRRYNGGPIVFLERKLKVDGRLYKRRSIVPLEDLGRVVTPADGLASESERARSWPGRWFARRLRNRRLGPVCQIAYSRTARVGASLEGALRLTIDSNVAALAIRSVRFTERSGLDILPGQAIIELKYQAVLPALFEQLIREFLLEPQTISKYRLAGHALAFTPAPLQIPSLVGN